MTIEELNVLFDLRAELEWLNTAKAQLMDAAASEDDAADPSSEKSGSVETDAKEQIKRLLDAEQA